MNNDTFKKHIKKIKNPKNSDFERRLKSFIKHHKFESLNKKFTDFNTIKILQLKFPNIKIVVYYDKTDFKEKLFENPKKLKKIINIFYLQDIQHFVYINSLTALFNCEGSCNFCHSLFKKKILHNCSAM